MLHFFKSSSKLLVLVPIVFIVSSCNQNKSSLDEYGSIFENVVRHDQGVLRGLSLGDSLKTVAAKESNKPIEEDTDYLYYEYKIDSITTYNIRYSFDERGLNEIESDIFIINNTELAEQTFNQFKKYFDQHYGNSESQGGFNVWNVKSEKYGDVMIDLSNEFPAFNAKNAVSKISVWIYPDKP